jgi:cytochrome c oxidase subunit 2
LTHGNLQMKIIVETEEEYNKWISEQSTFAETVFKDDTQPTLTAVDDLSMTE